MWVLSKPLLPKSFSSDVSVLFFWSVAGRVAAASESCALWATLLLVAVCWGGGPSSPFVWASLRLAAVSLNISSVALQGDVLAWLCGGIPRASAPPWRFGGAQRGCFPKSACLPARAQRLPHPKSVFLGSLFTFLSRV